MCKAELQSASKNNLQISENGPHNSQNDNTKKINNLKWTQKNYLNVKRISWECQKI